MPAAGADAAFLTRNAVDCLPAGALEAKLETAAAEGRRLRVKLGLDPTAPEHARGIRCPLLPAPAWPRRCQDARPAKRSFETTAASFVTISGLLRLVERSGLRAARGEVSGRAPARRSLGEASGST